MLWIMWPLSHHRVRRADIDLGGHHSRIGAISAPG